jgi:hypothetical protein
MLNISTKDCLARICALTRCSNVTALQKASDKFIFGCVTTCVAIQLLEHEAHPEVGTRSFGKPWRGYTGENNLAKYIRITNLSLGSY